MRLATRSDFDGLICAALLKQVERIDSIQFVHPKDLQDGAFVATPDDGTGSGGSSDTLSDRHTRRSSKDVTNETRVRGRDGRGNVAFVDGHAEVVNREDVHREQWYHLYK